MIDGIINVYKEAGYTSHDVVAKLRGILRQKKIGHTGTLDPEATGVLPVCLGKGTRLCDMLTEKEKTYQVDMLLGVTTDTQDITGTVQRECSLCCDELQVREAAAGFLGAQLQVPPMYSAIKVNGKKLYELAREGIEVERKPRPVHFYEIEVLSVNLPRVQMRVTCSKGTYIRTLCHDIGQTLGCGACMEKLVRSRVGRFELKDSVTLDQIREYAQQERISEILYTVESVFAEYPSFICEPRWDKLLQNGNPLNQEAVGPQEVKGWIKACDSTGKFIGIYEKRPGEGRYYPVKMFI